MHRLPPLIELRAFEAAARHLSFARAAEELHVTPTAISHQIKLLESHLGTTLFRRRPRPIALTPAGTALFPTIRDGLAAFAAALDAVRPADARPLVVTTTNAFAARWLLPRLPDWRARHPHIALEVIGTDERIDLRAGGADVAVRYARAIEPGLAAHELFRDRHWPMAAPALLPRGRAFERLSGLRGQTLIHAHWLPGDPAPPTWPRWLAAARAAGHDVPATDEMTALTFREEAHAIDAAIAGQGIAICSDVLVARELAAGTLVKAFDLPLDGYGFFLVHLPGRARDRRIRAFADWIGSAG
ncbi:MAG: LysR substrate-binding domain-containing protein [Alphaproteobacteria bacterium]